ncbi:MAG: NAD-dependent protein deacylase [Clostridiales bacterium]|jgi:NAD-dependent deacetylase|nr:NAD-dependent protein deacylase [Clostridiales bacterium]
MDNAKITQLTEIIKAGNAVFLGGAGVSTESGIPDFRGTYGLYQGKYEYPAEEILSIDFLEDNPEYFYEFYKKNIIHTEAKPNAAHIKLAELEAAGLLTAVITQNIDGLHQMAGSKNVVEMHGTIHKNYCIECEKGYPLEAVTEAAGIPRCPCGGIIRPEVTLYGESLDIDAITSAVDYISAADTLIIGGTSLIVYPVAGLPGYFKGRNLVIINKSRTPLEGRAKLVISASIGETLDLVRVS